MDVRRATSAMLEDHAGRVQARLQAALTSAEFTTNRPGMFDCYDCGRLVDPANLATVASHGVLYGKYLGVEGAEVLDVGAGLGVQSCIFALLGAKKVTSYDVTPEQHEGQRHLLAAFHPPLPVEPVLADWVSNPAPPDSADAVLMQESISHIRDTDKAIRSAVEALRPGLKCEFLSQPRTRLGGRNLPPVNIAKRLLAAAGLRECAAG